MVVVIGEVASLLDLKVKEKDVIPYIRVIVMLFKRLILLTLCVSPKYVTLKWSELCFVVRERTFSPKVDYRSNR